MRNLPSIGYSHPYTVQTYDIDQHRRMTLAALIRQMQEAAMQNVMQLKVSVWDMEAQHFSWVLLRKNLQVVRLPQVGEELNFTTYATGFDRVFTYRDFFVYDAEGKQLASSSSTWLLLHTESRRMVRIPDFVLKFAPQIPPPEDCLPHPTSDMPTIERVDYSTAFQVRWHDLDFNGHLNNVLYIQWMIEALPDEVVNDRSLQRLRIHYKVEGHWKDSTLSEAQHLDDNRYLHRLVRSADGKELATALTEWG